MARKRHKDEQWIEVPQADGFESLTSHFKNKYAHVI